MFVCERERKGVCVCVCVCVCMCACVCVSVYVCVSDFLCILLYSPNIIIFNIFNTLLLLFYLAEKYR